MYTYIFKYINNLSLYEELEHANDVLKPCWDEGILHLKILEIPNYSLFLGANFQKSTSESFL